MKNKIPALCEQIANESDTSDVLENIFAQKDLILQFKDNILRYKIERKTLLQCENFNEKQKDSIRVYYANIIHNTNVLIANL